MLRGPDALAQAAITIGNAKARAAEQSGQAWAGAAQQVGQDVASIPQQMAQHKAQQQELDVRQAQLDQDKLRLAQAAHAAGGQASMAGAMQSSVDPTMQPQGPDRGTPDGVVPQMPNFLKDEGNGTHTWDVEGLSKYMAGQGYGDLQPQFVKDLTGLNDAVRTESASRQATLRSGADLVAKSGYNPVFADQFLKTLEANKFYSPDQTAQIRQLMTTDPAKFKQVVDALGTPKKLGVAAPGSTIFDEQTGAPVTTVPMKSEAGKAEKASFGITLPDGSVKNVEGQFIPGEPGKPGTYQYAGEDVTTRVVKPTDAPKALESKSMLVDGKPAEVLFNPDPSAKVKYADPVTGADVSARVRPIPPASIQVMNQPLPQVTLNPHEEGIAKDLASGALTFSDFNRMYSSRSGAGQAVKEALYAKARELNPAFSPAQFEAGFKLATNPAVAQRVVAISALGPVIDKIRGLAADTGNLDVPAFNKLLMAGKFQLGNKTVTNFRQLQTLLGDEVGLALGVGTGSDLKTKLGLDLVNPTLSPDNFLSTMDQLQSILDARKQTLLSGMGVYGQGPSAVPVAQPPAPAPASGGVHVLSITPKSK